MSDDRIVEPRLLRGFRDYLPGQMNARIKMIDTIRRVYESYGFLPLDTPALEYHATLMGYGEDNAKQIFEFENPEEEHVALRFDLTAPLARVVHSTPISLSRSGGTRSDPSGGRISPMPGGSGNSRNLTWIPSGHRLPRRIPRSSAGCTTRCARLA